MVAAAAAMSCTLAHSRTEWYSWPPVKTFGVGRPCAESTAPSVPPRVSAILGATPALRIASRAASTTRGLFSM